MDKQQARCGHDSMGNEMYEGDEYWEGVDGTFVDVERADDSNPHNHLITMLLETLGTQFIMEQLGYVRRVYNGN